MLKSVRMVEAILKQKNKIRFEDLQEAAYGILNAVGNVIQVGQKNGLL